MQGESLRGLVAIPLLAIAVLPSSSASEDSEIRACLEQAVQILSTNVTEDSFHRLGHMGTTAPCSAIPGPIQEQFAVLVSVVGAVVNQTKLSADETSFSLQNWMERSPIPLGLAGLADNCPPTPMFGSISLTLEILDDSIPLNNQFAIGSASRYGVFGTSKVQMSVAGTQLYGLAGTSNAFASKGVIQIAGVPFPAATFGAGTTCGNVFNFGSVIHQTCSATAHATLINWNERPELQGLGLFQIVVQATGSSAIPCET